MEINCWEFKKSGRQSGGVNVGQLGICPAVLKNAGTACWMVAGTFCGDKVQGTFAEKEKNCMSCDFYKQFDLKHRAKVRQPFTH